MALLDKSFSEFPSTNVVNENDLLLLSSDVESGYDTRKTTARVVANAINNQLPMASLDTDSKNMVGAINELNRTLNGIFITPNQTININNTTIAGLLTDSQKRVMIDVPVGKFLTNVSSATVTSLVGGIRTIEAKYLNGSSSTYDWCSQSGITVSAIVRKNSNTVSISIDKTSAFTNAPATNTPIVGAFTTCEITFT